MKTTYGKLLLKEADKTMNMDLRRMIEIAKEFKAAKKKDWGNEYYAVLMDEFLECERARNAKQSIVNAMIRIEHCLK